MKDLIINNENFKKDDNGVVFSINPRGIVFVPRELSYLAVASGIEVIYSNAFRCSDIKTLSLPKSLKNICNSAFIGSKIESVTFEEGTELDSISKYSLSAENISNLKIPQIKEKIGYQNFPSLKTLELPPNFRPKIIKKS